MFESNGCWVDCMYEESIQGRLQASGRQAGCAGREGSAQLRLFPFTLSSQADLLLPADVTKLLCKTG